MSYIGLDLGTSRVKAVRFDAELREIDSESRDTTVCVPRSGWSEQDLEEVWSGAVAVVSALVARSDEPVDLLALTAQGDGCWLVDADGEPVGPALLWNDSRAAGIVDDWAERGLLDEAFAVNGSYGAPGLAHAQLAWLAEHDPDRVASAATLLSCGSWVYSRMTGRRVLEVTEAANPYLDITTRTYSGDLLDRFGLAWQRRLLPDTVDDTDRSAPLTPGAAAALGLPSGTPVALGPYDVPAMSYGAGTTEPGDAVVVLGTTLCVSVCTDDPRLSRPPGGMTLPGPAKDRWFLAYATLTGTQALHWAADALAAGGPAQLIDLAATSTHPEPPLFLPYLSPAGERAPFRDSRIRGSFHGLTFEHSRADLARSVVDGLSLAVRDCLDAAGPVGRLVLTGGGAGNPRWCQTLADACGLAVSPPDGSEIGARGAVVAGLGRTGPGATGPAGAAPGAADPEQEAVTYRPHAPAAARLADVLDRMRAARDSGPRHG